MNIDFSLCRDVAVPQEDESIILSPPPPHVKAGVEWILQRPFALLGDEMGAMKSAQSIITAQFLFLNNVIDRVIVIAPSAVRPSVWFSPEVGELSTHLFKTIYSRVIDVHNNVRVWEFGPKGPRRMDWILGNYEFIRSGFRVAPRSRKVSGHIEIFLPYAGKRTLLILDESSYVRIYTSLQTKACTALRRACGRVLLLNGTPLAEDPEDMFSQGNLMSPEILQCRLIGEFRARYTIQAPVLTLGGKPKLTIWGKAITKTEKWVNLEDLQRRFAPYILRRLTRDCVDLPPVLPPVTLTVTLTAETWRIYKSMREDLVAWLSANEVSSSKTAAIRVLRLAQITSGFIGGIEDERLFDDMLDAPPRAPVAAMQYISREKLDFLLSWHEERLHEERDLKLLVWCKWIPELSRWLQEVQRFGHPVGCIAGQSLLKQGIDVERAFAMSLLHPATAPSGAASVGGTFGTGALGLNFTACHTVVNVSHGYEPWKRLQAEKRVDRPGQHYPVRVFDIVAQGPNGQRTIDHITIKARKAKENLNNWTSSAWRRELMVE